MKDYYKTLGVDKSASKDDIKKAFRKLAHEHHPDKNKGNEAASAKFKEASEAYSVLSDDNKRKQYDTFGSAGPGFNPGQGGFGGFNGGQGFGGFDFSQFTQGQGVEFDLGDIFEGFFGGGRRRPRKGANITIDVQLTFKESVFGIEKEISVGGKEKLIIKIPPGVESGQGLRIGGRGEKGEGGPGDLIIRIWVTEDKIFRKEGSNIVAELNIKLTRALLGGNIDLQTLDGIITLKIPEGTNNGDILRIKGKGVPNDRGKRGDLLVKIIVNMPKRLSRQNRHLVEEMAKDGL